MLGIPLAAQLSSAEQASDRRHRLSLLQSEQDAAERQLDSLKEFVASQGEQQETLIAAQRASIDTLREATDINTEAVRVADEFARDQAQLVSEQLAELLKHLADVDVRLEATEVILNHYVTWWNSQVTGDAGGAVGARREDAPGGIVCGFPYASGDLRLWYLSHGMLPGHPAAGVWLVCDGSEVSIDAYRELYSVIGYRYGNPATAGNFRLPSKAQLTGDSILLGDDGLVFIIRT